VAGKNVEVTQAGAASSTVGIEGQISSLSGSCPTVSFVVNGPVNHADALAKTTVTTGRETKFSGGSCGDLGNKNKVRVSGTMSADGVVAASSVELVNR